jgi:hypothetical protein
VRPQPQHTMHAGPAGLTRRLPGRWLAVAIVAVAAVLAPGIVYATASLASPASPQFVSCRGVTQADFPADGFITDPARDQGGHLWWQAAGGSVCIGTVVEFVQYNVTATKTWQVIIYSAQFPDGLTVASATFTVRPGWYLWTFRVRQAFPGLSAVCITANESFGTPCIHFG